VSRERTDDPLIAQSEQAELEAHRSARAANLFDVRRFIGGLFAIYGVILTILGLGASDADIDRAADINVNLWTGLAMLAVAAVFLLWAFTRPLSDELEEAEREEDDRTVKGAVAPVGPDAAALAGTKTTSRRPRDDRRGPSGPSGSGSQQG
jgi:hypothetical protein